MKRGYKRLLVFELSLLFILFINCFFKNFLSGYGIVVFLLIVGILFKYLFGFEKDRHRFLKDIFLNFIIFLMAFLLLYYLFGIIIGFYRSGNYYNLSGLFMFILPIIFYVILREYLRYMFLCKSDGSMLLTVVTILLFSFLDISSFMYFAKVTSNYDIFVFISLRVLPALSSNIAFSYITMKVGYKPLIFYSLVITLYPYLFPIVPNPSQYLLSLIELLLPLALAYNVYSFFRKKENNIPTKDYQKQKKQIFSFSVISLVVVILVYFTSGYFSLWAIVIASNSMDPKIKKGDVVVIDKRINYKQLHEGQILAYKSDNIIVVHRIVSKAKVKDNYYFVTKGDSNKKEDNIVVSEDMIIGTVNYKIPYVGLPKIWLNEL